MKLLLSEFASILECFQKKSVCDPEKLLTYCILKIQLSLLVAFIMILILVKKVAMVTSYISIIF